MDRNAIHIFKWLKNDNKPLMFFTSWPQMLQYFLMCLLLFFFFSYYFFQKFELFFECKSREFKAEFSLCPIIRVWPPLSLAPVLCDWGSPITKQLIGIRLRCLSPYYWLTLIIQKALQSSCYISRFVWFSRSVF